MFITKTSPLYVLNFFTTWLIILVVFNPQVFQYVNLQYLAFVVMIGGLYMSFVNPRRFVCYIGPHRLEFTGPQKFVVVDLFFHILVFIFIIAKYGKYYSRAGLDGIDVGLMLMLVYLFMIEFDVKAVYGIEVWELVAVIFVANLAYVLVYL